MSCLLFRKGKTQYGERAKHGDIVEKNAIG